MTFPWSPLECAPTAAIAARARSAIASRVSCCGRYASMTASSDRSRATISGREAIDSIASFRIFACRRSTVITSGSASEEDCFSTSRLCTAARIRRRVSRRVASCAFVAARKSCSSRSLRVATCLARSGLALAALGLLALATRGGFLITLAATCFGQDASLLDLLIEAPERAFEALPVADDDFCHVRWNSPPLNQKPLPSGDGEPNDRREVQRRATLVRSTFTS